MRQSRHFRSLLCWPPHQSLPSSGLEQLSAEDKRKAAVMLVAAKD